MTVREKLAQYDMFEGVILSHGFTPYMRDYDVIVRLFDTHEGHYRFRFTHCPLANLGTRLLDSTWSDSWSDIFIDHERWLEADAPSGFVWGVGWSNAYPGLTYHKDSSLADSWSERFKQPMHEVSIETQVFLLQLVFHDVIIEKISDEAGVIDKVNIPVINS